MTGGRRWRSAVERLAFALSFVLGVLALGCSAGQAAPPRAPALEHPGDAIPPDLDLVLRIDLGRVRSALGPSAVSMIQGLGAAGAEPGAPQDLVTQALAKAEVVLVAARLDRGSELDTVVVLDGPLRGLVPPRSGWGIPTDLGGDVRRWDRKGRGPRESPARIYAFGDERLVVLTEAEIDSVEAVIERGMPANPLTPRSRGIVAFAFRLRGVRDDLAARAPLFAKALAGAKGLEGNLEPSEKGLTLDLSLELENDASAERARELIESVRVLFAAGDGPAAELARSATVTAAGHSVAIRSGVPPALVMLALSKLR